MKISIFSSFRRPGHPGRVPASSTGWEALCLPLMGEHSPSLPADSGLAPPTHAGPPAWSAVECETPGLWLELHMHTLSPSLSPLTHTQACTRPWSEQTRLRLHPCRKRWSEPSRAQELP